MREICITEKIDGTNALISIMDNKIVGIGSRTRWITPQDDNYGFARWTMYNEQDIIKLGNGVHYGEWWGPGIQKRYSGYVTQKKFSLFNVGRWGVKDTPPSCCDIVPVLYSGIFTFDILNETLEKLMREGSIVAPGCMNPEGIIIYHTTAKQYFKKTFEKDEEYKGKSA